MEYLFKKEKKSIRTKKDEIQENFERERREGDKKMSRRDEEVKRGHDWCHGTNRRSKSGG